MIFPEDPDPDPETGAEAGGSGKGKEKVIQKKTGTPASTWLAANRPACLPGYLPGR